MSKMFDAKYATSSQSIPISREFCIKFLMKKYDGACLVNHFKKCWKRWKHCEYAISRHSDEPNSRKRSFLKKIQPQSFESSKIKFRRTQKRKKDFDLLIRIVPLFIRNKNEPNQVKSIWFNLRRKNLILWYKIAYKKGWGFFFWKIGLSHFWAFIIV